MNNSVTLTAQQIKQISEVAFLKQSDYSNLDFQKTLVYMVKRYINPMSNHLSIQDSTFVDCGAGFGWLTFAFLLSGGKEATLCDIDEPRLNAAKEIAEILELTDRCTFISGPMQSLNFRENEFDIFASIETLEHVGSSNIDECLNLVAQTARKMVILTTPNKLFPLVIHDNKVPMSHWIPKKGRNILLKAIRINNDPNNDFVGPWKLSPIRKKFAPASRTLTFLNYENWRSSYPFYSPYNLGNRWKEKPPAILAILYWLLEKFLGRRSYLIAPNLCRIWIRK